MKVGLFIPCYINAIFPDVGVASYKLLKHLGIEVDYPVDQTCCGQPMANGGFEDKAIPLAKHFDELFAGFDYVVAPSASCTAFVKHNYDRLLKKENHKCQSVGKTVDICEFLHDVIKVDKLPGNFSHKVSVHNSCHGVRELHLSSASELNIPRYSKVKNLLSLIEGIDIVEPERVDECCGFGGMFAIEEVSISAAMGRDKVKAHMATGAQYITGADSSCLMHMQGIVDREKLPIQFIHAVQILASGL